MARKENVDIYYLKIIKIPKPKQVFLNQRNRAKNNLFYKLFLPYVRWISTWQFQKLQYTWDLCRYSFLFISNKPSETWSDSSSACKTVCIRMCNGNYLLIYKQIRKSLIKTNVLSILSVKLLSFFILLIGFQSQISFIALVPFQNLQYIFDMMILCVLLSYQHSILVLYLQCGRKVIRIPCISPIIAFFKC